MRHIWILAVLAVLFSAGPAAAKPRFIPLGYLPGGDFNTNYTEAHGVSASGRVVVGCASVVDFGGNCNRAVRWLVAGDGSVSIENLTEDSNPDNYGFSKAWDVSADGMTIVGFGSNDNGSEGFRWKPVSGMRGVGFPEQGPEVSGVSAIYAVSDAGNLLVGDGNTSQGPRAVRGSFGNLSVLGEPALGAVNSIAVGISGNGQVTVGQASVPPGGLMPVRWNGIFGDVLPLLPGDTTGSATDASYQGIVIVGQSGNQAYRYISTTQSVQGLGFLNPQSGAPNSIAQGVSSDGRIVVGSDTSSLPREAFIWTEADGMQNLKDVLVAAGEFTPFLWTLSEATAISGNGRYIVGHGVPPDGSGERQAWLVDLGPRSVVAPLHLLLLGDPVPGSD